MVPGEVMAEEGQVEINAGLSTIEFDVTNTGDRKVMVGSHHHLYEVDDALRFDRERARGYRLDRLPGIGASCGLERRLIAVENVRDPSKADMVHNALLPKMEVNPETFDVRADGGLLTCEPLKVPPMAQRHFLY